MKLPSIKLPILIKSVKPINHVANKQQSGAGRHNDKRERKEYKMSNKEITNTYDEGETSMTWHYAIAEYRLTNPETNEVEVDRAEMIEVFNIYNARHKEYERCWSDTSLMSDTAETMQEMMGRMAKDIATQGNKPSVIVMTDYQTGKDKEWWWADQPEVKHMSEGANYIPLMKLKERGIL